VTANVGSDRSKTCRRSSTIPGVSCKETPQEQPPPACRQSSIRTTHHRERLAGVSWLSSPCLRPTGLGKCGTRWRKAADSYCDCQPETGLRGQQFWLSSRHSLRVIAEPTRVTFQCHWGVFPSVFFLCHSPEMARQSLENLCT